MVCMETMMQSIKQKMFYSHHRRRYFHAINRKWRHLRHGAIPSKFFYSEEAKPRKTLQSMKLRDQSLLSSDEVSVSNYEDFFSRRSWRYFILK
uniref:Uncharacterized protein n=1 Tax=Lepeophtheirus salmonis TaxID=72036 RepID=A0A0K2UQ73_LEPSM